MRRKFSILLVVVMLIVTCVSLFACTKTAPPITTTPGGDDTNAGVGSVASSIAWDKIVSSIVKLDEQDKTVLNLDQRVVVGGNIENGSGDPLFGYNLAFDMQGSIDARDALRNGDGSLVTPIEKSKSAFKIEMKKINYVTNEESTVFGAYYKNGVLLLDVSVLSGGKTVFKVTDADVPSVVEMLKTTYKNMNLQSKLNDLLNTNIDVLNMKVIDLVVNLLFKDCTIVEDASGKSKISVNLEAPDKIIEIGLNALAGMLGNVGTQILSMIDGFGIKFGFNGKLVVTTDVNGVFENIDSKLSILLKDQAGNVNNALSVKYQKQDIFVDNGVDADGKPNVKIPDFPETSYVDFSFTELTLDVNVHVDADQDGNLTINGISNAFGSLLTNLLGNIASSDLGKMPISLKDIHKDMKLTVRADVDMINNANSVVLIRLTTDKGMVAGLYYYGAENTMYVDLSGVLGDSGKYKVENLDLSKVVREKLNSVIGNIGKNGKIASNENLSFDQKLATYISETVVARGNSTISDEDRRVVFNQVMEMLGKGSVEIEGKTYEIVKEAKISEAGVAEVDVFGIIKTVLKALDVNMGAGITIDSIVLDLSDEVLISILGMFTENPKLPLHIGEIRIDAKGFMTGANFSMSITGKDVLQGIGIKIGSTGKPVAPGETGYAEYLEARTFLKYGAIDEFAEQGVIYNSKDFISDKVLTVKEQYFTMSENGKLNIEKLSVGATLSFGYNASDGDLGSIKYEDSAVGTIINLMLKSFGNNQANIELSVKANLNLKSLLSSEIQLQIRVDNDDNKVVTIILKEKYLYLDLTSLLGESGRIKIDISQFVKDGATSDDAVATANEPGASNKIDMIGLVGIALKGVNVGDGYIEVLLATGVISKVLNALDNNIVNKISFSQEFDEGVGGIRLTMNDGLNLTQINLFMYATIGAKVSFTAQLGDIQVQVAPLAITVADDDKYIDFMSNPNLFLSLNSTIDLNAKAGTIDLSKGLDKLLQTIGISAGLKDLIISEDINTTIEFNLQAKLDLEFLMLQLSGKVNTPAYNSALANNNSELLLEIKTTRNGNSEVALGIYYQNKRIFIDGKAIGLQKFSVNIDLVSMIAGILNKPTQTPTPSPAPAESIDAVSSALLGGASSQTTKDIALDFVISLAQDGVRIEIAKGLTDMLLNFVGVGLEDIKFNLGIITKGENAGINFDFAIVNEGVDQIGINAHASMPNLKFFEKKDSNKEELKVNFPDLVAGWTNIQILNDQNKIVLPPVHLELQGYFEFKAGVNDVGDNTATVGEWLNSVAVAMIAKDSTQGLGATLDKLFKNPDVKSFISKLVAEFKIPANIGSTIGFKISVNLKLDSLSAYDSEGKFQISKLIDVNYILSHSDIAFEIYNDKVDSTSQDKKKLVGIYLIYSGENGLGNPYSNLYVDLDGILGTKDIHVKLQGFSIDALLGTNQKPATPTPTPSPASQSVVDATSSASTSTPADENKNTMNAIAALIGAGISSFVVDKNGVEINLGQNLVGVLLGTFLQGMYVDDGNGGKVLAPMMQLGSGSKIKYDWTKGEVSANIEAKPLSIGFGIGGLLLSLDGQTKVVGKDFDENSYIGLESLTEFSIALSADLNLQLKGQDIKVQDYLSAFIANLAIDLDVKITDDMIAGLSLNIAGDINLNNANDTRLLFEMKNASQEVVFGFYLKGSALYIDMGSLSSHNAVVNDVKFAEMLKTQLQNMLKKVTASGQDPTGQAVVAEQQSAMTAEDALQIIVSLAKNEVKLELTQDLIFALLEVIINKDKPESARVDLSGILNGENGNPNLGLSISINVDTNAPSISIVIDSSIITLTASINDPYIATKISDRYKAIFANKLTGADWNGYYMQVDGAFYKIASQNRYSKNGNVYIQNDLGDYFKPVASVENYLQLIDGTTIYSLIESVDDRVNAKIDEIKAENNFSDLNDFPYASFELNLTFAYDMKATFVKMTAEEVASYQGDKYSRDDAGRFYLDKNGTYKKLPVDLQAVLDAVLSMDSLNTLKDIVLSTASDGSVLKLGDILARLALQLQFDDPQARTINFAIKGNVDFKSLGLMDVIRGEKSLSTFKFDLQTIYKHIDVQAVISTNADNEYHEIAFGLIDEFVYINLEGLGGPKFKINFAEIMKLIAKPAPTPTPAEISATGDPQPAKPKFTISDAIGIIVKSVVIKAAARVGEFTPAIDSINIGFNSNMLTGLLDAILGTTTTELARFDIDENNSGVFAKFGSGLGLTAKIAFMNGTSIGLEMAGENAFVVDVARNTIIFDENQKNEFVDLSNFKIQNYNFSVQGELYLNSDGEKSYDISGLFGGLLGDMLVQFGTNEMFKDSLIFRLSADFNMADLYLEYFTSKAEFALIAEGEYVPTDERYVKVGDKFELNPNGDYKCTKKKATLKDFIEKSDFSSLELALEMLARDENNNIKETALGGFYLHANTLYFDGDNVFASYDGEKAGVSMIPNVSETLIKIAGTMDSISDSIANAGKKSEKNAGASATQENPVSEKQQRDAVIQLLMNDPSIQLVLTKSFISILLGMIVPDLGQIGTIFDNLNISLSVDKGEYIYNPITSDALCAPENRFDKLEDGTFAQKNDGEWKILTDSKYVKLDFSEVYLGTKYTYTNGVYVVDVNGEFKKNDNGTYSKIHVGVDGFEADWKGARFEIVYTPNGNGTHVKLNNEYYSIPAERYAKKADGSGFYLSENGNYILIGNGYVDLTTLSRFNVSYASGAQGGYKFVDATYGLIVEYNHRYKKVETYAEDQKGLFSYVIVEGGTNYYKLTANLTDAEKLKTDGKTYRKYFKYEANPTNEFNPEYNLYKTSRKYREISDFGVRLNVQIGTLNLGFGLFGVDFGFGRQTPIIPDRVINEAVLFSEKTMEMGFAVDFSIFANAGIVDIGMMFSEILGDIYGVVVDVPEYDLGSAEITFRAKVATKLNLKHIEKSELLFQLLRVTPVGEEDMLFALYFQEGTLYLDASKIGMPKISIDASPVVQKVVDMLKKLVGMGGATQSDDAISTADNNANIGASILVSSGQVMAKVGNAMFDYFLKLVKIDGKTLFELLYDNFEFGANLTANLKFDDIYATELKLDAQVSIPAGDKYVLVAENEVVDNSLRVQFVQDKEGKFVKDAQNQFVRAYVFDKIADTDRFAPKFYLATENLTPEQIATQYPYKCIKGDPANKDEYEKVTKLSLKVGNVVLKFSKNVGSTLSPEQIAEFTPATEYEHLIVEETIEISAKWLKGSDDLSTLLHLFFDTTDVQKLEAYFEVEENLHRQIFANFKVDIRTTAILNVIRQKYVVDGPNDTKFSKWYEGDTSFLDAAEFLLAAKDYIDIMELLSYVNTAIEIYSLDKDGYRVEMGAVYIQGGTYEMVANYVQAEEDFKGERYSQIGTTGKYVLDKKGSFKQVVDKLTLQNMDGKDRYSHYFADPDGAYVYDEQSGTFVVANAGMTGQRYSYDYINYYQNNLGEFKRNSGGIYILLDFFGIQPLYFESLTYEKIFKNLTEKPGGDAVTTEANSTAVSDNSGENVTSSLFPLLNETYAGYVKMFLYGLQFTSDYAAILLQPDFIDRILELFVNVEGGINLGHDFEKSNIKFNLNFDQEKYEKASLAQLKNANVSKFKFVTVPNAGLYTYYNGKIVKVSSLAPAQIAKIDQAKRFNIEKVLQSDVNLEVETAGNTANTATTFYIFDASVSLVEANVYVFENSFNVTINRLEMTESTFVYDSNGVETAKASDRYTKKALYSDAKFANILNDGKYFFHNVVDKKDVYFEIKAENRYNRVQSGESFNYQQDATGNYIKIGNEFKLLDDTNVKHLLKYNYYQDDNGEYVRRITLRDDTKYPSFEKDQDGNLDPAKPIEYTNLDEIKTVRVKLQGDVTIQGNAKAIALSEILSGLVGNLSTQIMGSSSAIRVGFSIASNIVLGQLNLSKIGNSNSVAEIFNFQDIQLAIDLWLFGEDGSRTEIAGIYLYDNNLYIDASYLLRDAGFIKVEFGRNDLIEIINSILTKEKNASAQEGATILPSANMSIAGIYLAIQRNNFSLSLSSALLKVVAKSLFGDNMEEKLAMLPNVSPYVNIHNYPLTISAGVKLFNEAGTEKVADIALNLYGLDERQIGTSGELYSSVFKVFKKGENTHDIFSAFARPTSNVIISENRAKYHSVASLNVKALLGLEKDEVFKITMQNVKVAASLEMDFNVLAGIVDWSEVFKKMFVNEEEVEVLISALNKHMDSTQDALSKVKLELQAFVNIQNMLDSSKSLIEKLAGAEIQIALTMNSTILPWANGDSQDVSLFINAVVNNNGTVSLFLDFSDLATKMKLGSAFAKIKLENIDISKQLSNVLVKPEDSLDTSGPDATTSAVEQNTGILPDTVFNIVDSFINSLSIQLGKIAIVFNDDLINSAIRMFVKNEDLVSRLNFAKMDKTEFKIEFNGSQLDISLQLSADNKDNKSLNVDAAGNKYALISSTIKNWTGNKYTRGNSSYVEDVDGNYKLVNGNYVLISANEKYEGVKFKKHFEFVLDANGKYLCYNDITMPEYVSVEAYTENWTGATYNVGADGSYVLAEGTTGKFMKSADYLATQNLAYAGEGDIDFKLKFADLGIKLNETQSGFTPNPSEYKNLLESQFNLHFGGSLDFVAKQYNEGKPNIMDLSGLGGLLAGSGIQDFDLSLAISNDFELRYKFGLSLYIDLKDFGKTEVVLEITDSVTNKTTLAAYILPNFDVNGAYVSHNIYADLSMILGEQGKLALTNFDLKSMLDGILGKVLPKDATAQGNEDAAASLVSKLYPALLVMLKPEYFGIALNANLINAFIHVVQEAKGQPVKDLIPDLGEILLELVTDTPDHALDINFNIKVTDSVYGTMKISELIFAGEAATSLDKGFTGYAPTKTQLADFIEAYNMKTKEVLIDSLSLELSGGLAFTTTGLTPSDPNYDKTFTYWLGSLIDGLLESALGADKSNATGKDFIMTMPKGVAPFTFSIKADINVKALFGKTGLNLGGIIYSDFVIDFKFGNPINKKILSVAYLGSTRLNKTGDYNYEVTNGVGEGFSDALYLDLTTFGLGKLKLSGLMGMLGMSSKLAKVPTPDAVGADNVSSNEATAQAGLTSISAGLSIEKGKIGVSMNNSLLMQLPALLGLNIDLGEVPIKDVKLELEYDFGIKSISLNSTLDSTGSTIDASINVDSIKFNTSSKDKLVDIDQYIAETSTGYAGLAGGTMSVGGIVQGLLAALDPNVTLTLQKYTPNSKILSNANTYNSKNDNMNYGSEGSNDASTLSVKLSRPKELIDIKGYQKNRIKIDIYAFHPVRDKVSNSALDRPFYIPGTLYNSNVVITSLSDVLPGTDIIGTIRDGMVPLNLATMLGSSNATSMFNLYEILKGDNNYYTYPTNGDLGGVENKNDAPDYDKIYKWKPSIANIVKKLEVNLMNVNGYGITNPSNAELGKPGENWGTSVSDTPFEDERYTSIIIELDKMALNELLCFVYYMVMGLFGDAFVSEAYNQAGVGAKYATLSSLMAEFEKLAYTEIEGESETRTYEVVRQERLARINAMVALMQPYANAIPGVLVRNFITGLGYPDFLLNMVGGNRLGALSVVADSIFPIPFADMKAEVPNPKLCLFIEVLDENTITDRASGIKSIELYINATSTQTFGTEYLRLAVQSTKTSDDMISLLEVDRIEKPQAEIEAPVSITVTDPATRKATVAYADGTTKSIYLTAEYFIQEKLFPQKANVYYTDGTQNLYEPSSDKNANQYGNTGGVYVAWDAASVNLTSANESNQWLAGYAYGYVLSKVMYQIPVYVTNAYEVTGLKSYVKNGDIRSSKNLVIDMNVNSANFNLDLPDEVRITFRAGGTKTFSTKYVAPIAEKDIDKCKLDRAFVEANTFAKVNDTLAKRGSKFVEYREYLLYLNKEYGLEIMTAITSDGKTVMYDWNEKSSATSSYPAGKITWEKGDFKYDLNAGTIVVYYTYEWGLSEKAKNFVEIPIVNNEIASVTKFVASNGTETKAFDKFNAFDLKFMADQNYNLYEYIKQFNTVNGKYDSYTQNGVNVAGKSFAGLSVDWDLKNLIGAMNSIHDNTRGPQNLGAWDYYKGINTYVYAYIADKSIVVNSSSSLYPKASEITKLMNREDFETIKDDYFWKYSEYGTKYYYVRQQVKVDVKVEARKVVNFVNNTFDIDAYDFTSLQDNGAIPNQLQAIFNIGEKDLVKKWMSNGVEMTMTIPQVNAGDITINGYKGKDNLFVTVVVGNDACGKQTFKIPVNVRDMIPTTKMITVTDSLNPQWFKEFGAMKVAFEGGINHDLVLDWSTWRLFTKEECTEKFELVGENKNIFNGGIFYVLVDSYKEVAGVEQNGTRQQIKLMVFADEKVITDVKFYDGVGDINSESSFNATTIGVDTYDYVSNPNAFFKNVGWNNDGAKVKITYQTAGMQKTGFAFVGKWMTDTFAPNYNSESSIISYKIGNQELQVNVLSSKKIVDTCEFTNGSISQIGKTFKYSAFDKFELPTKANVVFADGKTASNVSILWNNVATPTMAELQAGSISREMTFFNENTEMKQTVTVQIIIDNYANIQIEKVVYDNLQTTYHLFGEFKLPSTATVTYNGGTIKSNVSVVWNNTNVPTSEEIVAGTFARTATILSDEKFQETVTFTVVTNYELFIGNETVKENYVLTKANFYKGLPNSGKVVYAGGIEIPVTIEWIDANYDHNGLAQTNVRVRISANGISSEPAQNIASVMDDKLVSLTIEKAGITDLVDYDSFVFDPFGLYQGGNKLPENGSMIGVIIGGTKTATGIEGGLQTQLKVSYELPQNLMTSADIFGKTINLELVFVYNGGVEKLVREVKIANRTIDSIVDLAYRSLTIDPFGEKDFAWYATNANKLQANVGDETFEFEVRWPVDFAIKNSGGFYPNFMVEFAYKLGENKYSVQSVNIPVNVLNRDIVKTEIVLGENYKLVESKENRFDSVYKYANVVDSQIIQIEYSNNTNMPTVITVFNPNAYVQSSLPKEMKIVFANGDYKYYALEWNVDANGVAIVGSIFEKIDIAKGGKSTIKVGIKESENSAKSISTFGVDLEVNALKLKKTNSDISSLTLDSKLRYSFSPYYKNAGQNAFVLANYATSAKIYLDGKFVKQSAINLGSYAGYNMLEEKYAFNPTTAKYEVTANGDYRYVYSICYNAPLAWNLSSLAFDYNGGIKYVDASVNAVQNGVATESSTMRVPVDIKKQTLQSMTFANGDFDDYDAVAIEVFKNNTFDPWSGIDYFSKLNVNKYFPARGTAVFSDGTTTWEQNVNIVWDFASVNVSYAGGEFVAKIKVNEPELDSLNIKHGQFDYVDSKTKRTVLVGSQSLDHKLVFANREAKLMTTGTVNQEIYNSIGFYSPSTFNIATQTYIDPYNFEIPSFGNSIEVMVEGKGKMTFSTTDKVNNLQWYTGGFNPVFSGGKTKIIAKLTVEGVTQNLEIPFLVQRMYISKMQGFANGNPSGTTALADNTNGSGNYYGEFYTDETRFGQVKNNDYTYFIKPFFTSSYDLPYAYLMDFKVWKFNPQTEHFETTTDVANRAFHYAKVSMPTTFHYGFAEVNAGENAYQATVSLAGQQYVTVPVGVIGVQVAGLATGETLDAIDDGTATTKLKTTAKANVVYSNASQTTVVVDVPVAWYGSVQRFKMDNITVVSTGNFQAYSAISSSVFLTQLGGRKAVYTLRPVLGVMVLSNGELATSKVLANDEMNGSIVMAKAGAIIPVGAGAIQPIKTITSLR